MINETFSTKVTNLIGRLTQGDITPDLIDIFDGNQLSDKIIQIHIVDLTNGTAIGYDGLSVNGSVPDHCAIASALQPQGATIRWTTSGQAQIPVVAAGPGHIWITCAFYHPTDINLLCEAYLLYAIGSVLPVVLEEIEEVSPDLLRSQVRHDDLIRNLEHIGITFSYAHLVTGSIVRYSSTAPPERAYNFIASELAPASEDRIRDLTETLLRLASNSGRYSINDTISLITNNASSLFTETRSKFLVELANQVLIEFTEKLRTNYTRLAAFCESKGISIVSRSGRVDFIIPNLVIRDLEFGEYKVRFHEDMSQLPTLFRTEGAISPILNGAIHPDFISGNISTLPELCTMLGEYDLFSACVLVFDRLENPQETIMPIRRFRNFLSSKEPEVPVEEVPQSTEGTVPSAPTINAPVVEADTTTSIDWGREYPAYTVPGYVENDSYNEDEERDEDEQEEEEDFILGPVYQENTAEVNGDA